MPFYYDVNRSTTTNAAAGTETTHLWAATVSNQQSMGIYAVYFAPFGTAAIGAAVGRVKTNTGRLCRRWNRHDAQGQEPSCPGRAERLEK